MPHLSPMNWLLALISIWLMTSILMSIAWWHPSLKWPTLSTTSATGVQSTWYWQ